MTRALQLFTTSGCHLCEQAEILLAPVLVHANRLREQTGLDSLTLERVEIADDPLLAERYGVRIPVLCVQDDAQELGWPFDQSELFTFLAASR